ncbi:hypothetical protein [Actinomadura sp. 3N407]|uniref:hypothetical protein n=1 Tax=Actinomadura sp. 3N407 TaxID=3457423 RepID=UPI003FCEB6B1
MTNQPDPSGSEEQPPAPETWWKRVWKFTDHSTVGQIVGGAALAVILAVATGVFVSGGKSSEKPEAGPTGTPSGQDTTSQSASPESLSLTATATPDPRPRQVFAGRLVIPMDKGGEKTDLDTVPPRNIRYGEEGGDISYSNELLRANDPDDTGASFGRYAGEGNPTLAQCEHTVQEASISQFVEPERRAWICILTEEGSVIAFKISTVGRAVEGQATIWHTQ